MRGLLILVGIILFTAIGCVAIPFVVMPNAGVAAALPVIYVPGEPLESIGHIPGTNVEVTNTMFSTWIVMILTLLWVVPIAARLKEVPGRGQAFIEMIVELWYGFAKGVLGPKGRQLMPLILTIFFFLLPANLIKIVPGVDTIGELHCAGITPGVDSDEATEEDFLQFSGYEIASVSGDSIVRLNNDESLNSGDTISFKQWKDCKETLHAGEHLADHSEDAEDHSEDEESEVEGEDGENTDADGDSTEGEGDGANLVLTSNAVDNNDGGSTPSAEGEEHARYYQTDPADDLYVVTPFIRGPSTDLSLTFAMAIVAWLVVQYMGVKELGAWGYGQKFLNLPALEAGGIKAIDFAVGLLEIVLELMKMVSWAFRLFGAMFAGQVLMFVIVFLVGTFVPIAVVGLEVFVGLIQAFVFAVLFLMFAATAMTSHHDDHGHEEGHH